MSQAGDSGSPPLGVWPAGPLDPKAAERIRSMLLGLSADLVAHLSRSTGASPEPDADPPTPIPQEGTGEPHPRKLEGAPGGR